eukprot:g59963.t1
MVGREVISLGNWMCLWVSFNALKVVYRTRHETANLIYSVGPPCFLVSDDSTLNYINDKGGSSQDGIRN